MADIDRGTVQDVPTIKELLPYHLEPGDSGHPLYVDPLWVSRLEAVELEPNPHFASLEHLKAALRSSGAQVDPPAGDGELGR